MKNQFYCVNLFGYESALINVEVDVRSGVSSTDIVGISDNMVNDVRKILEYSFINSEINYPAERVLISLSPCDIKKDSKICNLAIAMQIAAITENIEVNEKIGVIGDLYYNGEIKSINGGFAMAKAFKDNGIKKVIAPLSMKKELDLISWIKFFYVENLRQALNGLSDESNFIESENINQIENFSEIEFIDGIPFKKIDEEEEKRFMNLSETGVESLLISCSGNLSMITISRPGEGKTLLSQNEPLLNPLNDIDKAMEVTRIYSTIGLVNPNKPLNLERPFRMPHYTSSIEGMCGGGANCSCGEITLSHNGTLFLDDTMEFRSSVIQMLRVPLESKTITLSRAGRSTVFPADFKLLLACNPCPCGNYGDKDRICLCSAKSIEMYWNKISAPLLDRVPLKIFIKNSEDKKNTLTTSQLRKSVANARIMQKKRGKLNADLNPTDLIKYCEIDEKSKIYLDEKTDEFFFSARTVSNVLKIARTLADMEMKEKIRLSDLKKAVELAKIKILL